MSIFSKIGKAVKKGIGAVGSVAKKAAPLVGLIPGVGTVAGGLIGGLGSVADDFGHGRSIDLGSALKSGAAGATSGLVGSKLGGATGILGKAKGLLKGSPAPMAAQAADPLGDMGGATGGFAQQAGAPSLLSRIGGYISKNPMQAAQLGLAGANIVGGAKAAGRANALQNKALTRIEQPTAVDLSSTFAPTGNPYSAQPLNPAQLAALRSMGKAA